ncbi:MAG: hypothetical protein IK015_08870 [Treponema sp.]|nr:hypothetical protein [Treponema sp.]
MKKVLSLTLLAAWLLAEPAFAKIETLPQTQRPKQFLQFDMAASTNRGIERNQNWLGMEYNFDWQPFGFFAAFQLDSRTSDWTLRSDYLPFAGYHQNGVWRFGAATTYHAQRYKNSYWEHDLLEEFEVRWISNTGLTFTVRNGYVFRLTTFDALNDFKITDHDFCVFAEVDKVWSNGLELFTSLGSYNLYRYPRFFCPQWNFGAAYNIKDAVRLGVLLDVSMTDFWASAAYFNHILVRWNVRFSF